MRVGMTYDLQMDPTDPRQAEFDPPRTVEAVEAALQALGHEVVRLGNAPELIASRSRLSDLALIFNIAEGTFGRCREAWVPALLEHWGIPFVGSGAATQALALDKLMSKRVARASGVATPNWAAMEPPVSADDLVGLTFPLIVKPRYEGSGLGIDPDAIVRDVGSLRQRVERISLRFHQPCLVEEFIPFGELTVMLIGNDPPRALPTIQRPLDPSTHLSCHVAGQAAATAWLTPVELTPALDAAARRMAIAVFEALGCRDMARVDLRVDEAGQLYFLEINPLPSCDPDGSLGLLAEHLGTTYTQLIGQILDATLSRLARHHEHV